MVQVQEAGGTIRVFSHGTPQEYNIRGEMTRDEFFEKNNIHIDDTTIVNKATGPVEAEDIIAPGDMIFIARSTSNG